MLWCSSVCVCCHRHPMQTADLGSTQQGFKGNWIKWLKFPEDCVGVCCPLSICHCSILGNLTLSGSNVRVEAVTVIPHTLIIGVIINISYTDWEIRCPCTEVLHSSEITQRCAQFYFAICVFYMSDSQVQNYRSWPLDHDSKATFSLIIITDHQQCVHGPQEGTSSLLLLWFIIESVNQGHCLTTLISFGSYTQPIKGVYCFASWMFVPYTRPWTWVKAKHQHPGKAMGCWLGWTRSEITGLFSNWSNKNS